METFWDYSLRLWGRPGVERACLALQDGCGADVNVLLFCSWLGSAGRSVDRRLLRRAIASVSQWRSAVVLPLREARRAIKRGIADVPPEEAGRVRKGIARIELEAEKVEQRLLERHGGGAKATPGATAERNLDRYLRLLGGARQVDCRPLLEAASSCARGGFAP